MDNALIYLKNKLTSSKTFYNCKLKLKKKKNKFQITIAKQPKIEKFNRN